MKPVWSIWGAVVLFFSLVLFSTGVCAEEGETICLLYGKADAEVLLQQKIPEGRVKKTVAPAGMSCKYFYGDMKGKHSLEFRVSQQKDLVEEGIFDSASDVMTRQKRARKNSATASKKFQEIPGIGDDAFWEGTSLWIRKKETLVVVTSRPGVDGAFTDKDEMYTAIEARALNISKKVATTILERLPST